MQVCQRGFVIDCVFNSGHQGECISSASPVGQMFLAELASMERELLEGTSDIEPKGFLCVEDPLDTAH